MSSGADIVQQLKNAIVCVQATSRRVNFAAPFLSRTTNSSTSTGFIIELSSNLKDGRHLHQNMVDDGSGAEESQTNKLHQEIFASISRTPTKTPASLQCRFVLTCAHCVENSDIGDIFVTLPEHGMQKFDAVVLKFCPEIDTALLLVFIPDEKADNLNCLQFGSSESLVPGERVLSIGFPLGGRIKTTEGTFSGHEGAQGIQHTSPISPGNSGGPLLCLRTGKVVGINYQGVSGQAVSLVLYAQPCELVQQMLEDVRVASTGDSGNLSTIHRRQRLGICFHNTMADRRGSACDRGGVVVYHYEDVTVASMKKHTGHQCDGCREEFNAWFDTMLPKTDAGAERLEKAPEKKAFRMHSIGWTSDDDAKALYKLSPPESAILIDCFGQVSVELVNKQGTMPGDASDSKRLKIGLSQLIRRLPSEALITLHGQFLDAAEVPDAVFAQIGDAESGNISLQCKKNFQNRGPRAFRWYPYEGVCNLQDHYLCFMGMCFMEMTRNHVEFFPNLKALEMNTHQKGMNERRIIVTWIFPNTPAATAKVIRPGDTICHVNDVDIFTKYNAVHDQNILLEFKKLITDQFVQKESIVLINSDNMRIEMSQQQIAEQHNVNVTRHDYPQETTGPHAAVVEYIRQDETKRLIETTLDI